MSKAKMTSERINQIQEKTACPNSTSVQQALFQVWNECEQYHQIEIDELKSEIEMLKKEKEWINLQDLKPHSYKRGNWDGLMSDELLLIDEENILKVGVCYQGTIDGNKFCEFYDNNSGIEIKNVIKYKSIQ